ncbi:MAG: hypothetical protein A2Y93_12535, partial [Chloroflexi bacterium RBG_13_68_17]
MSPRRGEGAARYRVMLYCPDRHLVYDGRTPDEAGVGGGITARVRMARALRRLGHRVTMVVNCSRPRRIDGVDYVPLDGVARLSGDVVILTTSGGGLDLTPALALEAQARLRIVWVHGPDRPAGFEALGAEAVYAVSNFIGRIVRLEWGVAGERLFVAYNGYDEASFARAEKRKPRRDPHRLVYFSHPSKGLAAAIGVLRRLRARDLRFALHVFGGPGLWGGTGDGPDPEDGLVDHGLVGQTRLAEELLRSAFSIHLQTRREPGALAIPDALRAGCVLLGSPVGCYPEVIRDGVNGFLVPGDADDDSTQARAAERVLTLAANPPMMDSIRRT